MDFFELDEYEIDYDYPNYKEHPTYKDACWIRIIKKSE